MNTTTSKPTAPMFMPAPKPAKRLSPEDAHRLNEISADLGFARPMSDTGAPPKLQTNKVPNEHLPGTGTQPNAVKAIESKSQSSVAAAGAAKARPSEDLFGNAQPLRLDIPQDLWLDLKVTAAKRRVSVRWLVLEALEKAGYDVSINNIPEDGRRVRNNL
ncbi:hypothetical protein PbB2_02787 [Candidatus Phycosocius bacilliformis]|uniref:Uncharacterized protein n=1 Tax=Candidatus Phycosocius bacilliformis TaxID=1445552 RepID=A0A2P2EDE4_9PROT|nr:hypothetical protein [Candidatus Phycosocius bacilliformis]GBF59095.1 hypothetical protein PbB2_02787 [Candidatus Phycosocius bacilliformis]